MYNVLMFVACVLTLTGQNSRLGRCYKRKLHDVYLHFDRDQMYKYHGFKRDELQL